jgi:hypothetical protein
VQPLLPRRSPVYSTTLDKFLMSGAVCFQERLPYGELFPNQTAGFIGTLSRSRRFQKSKVPEVGRFLKLPYHETIYY